jgi:protein-disulfide isomerase
LAKSKRTTQAKNKPRPPRTPQPARGIKAKTPAPRAVPGKAGPEAFLTSRTGILAVTAIAVLVVVAMIKLGPGFKLPTAAPPTVDPAALTAVAAASGDISPTLTADYLKMCTGEPCPSLGSADAKVTVVEVSDYACTHCKDFHATAAPIIEQEYADAGKVRYVSHVFGFTPATQAVAAAALCADEQGKYFAFQQRAFADAIALTEGADIATGISAVGKATVPDVAAFDTCVTAGRYTEAVKTMSLEAKQAGLEYTPTILINDEKIEGAVPIDVFREKIDRALAAQG